MARTKSKRPGTRSRPPTRPRPAARPRPRSAARPKVKATAARRPRPPAVEAALFAPLTEGERAAALRVLLEDERVHGMAKIGRYRVISIEPLVLKPPDELAGRRLARVIIFDYAADVCVDACVDLDRDAACRITHSTAQPALSAAEEDEAVAIAGRDERVAQAAGGSQAVAVLHYWSRREQDIASRRRSAAVVFADDSGPSHVVVVDLIDAAVAEIVPAAQW